MIPFITSRTSTWRLLPPRLAGGINGSTCAHSSSVRSLGYRNLLRSYRPRFFAVHIGGASLESGHHFESQTIQRTQNVFGRTLTSTIGLPTQLVTSHTSTPPIVVRSMLIQLLASHPCIVPVARPVSTSQASHRPFTSLHGTLP